MVKLHGRLNLIQVLAYIINFKQLGFDKFLEMNFDLIGRIGKNCVS
jgi:hypothetical protein